jgi:hypothetical protein
MTQFLQRLKDRKLVQWALAMAHVAIRTQRRFVRLGPSRMQPCP